MTIFKRQGNNLLYQRKALSEAETSFKRIDYAWRRRTDGTIYAELPDRDSSKPWFLEVFNGRFTWQSSPSSPYLFVYELPEYLKSNFDPRHHGRQLAYKREDAQVVGTDKIRVSNTPVVDTEHLRIKVGDSPVFWGERLLDSRPLSSFSPSDVQKMRHVVDANLARGEFVLEPALPMNAKVQVEYHYHPKSYIYQGYKGKDERFYFLDLNPTAGHMVTLETTSGAPVDFYTRDLLGKTLYLYLLPAYVMQRGENGYWEFVEGSRNFSVLRHLSEPAPEKVFGWKDSLMEAIAIQEGIPARDIVKLLAEITLNANVALNKLELIDTRTRGGGIKKGVKLESIGVEAQFCWDIGFWDGEPYQQNGVVIIQVPQRVLKRFGGAATEDDVRKAVERHLQYGDLPIIEYTPDLKASERLPMREVLFAEPLPPKTIGSAIIPMRETLEDDE